MRSTQDFKQFYQESLKPELQVLDQRRKSFLKDSLLHFLYTTLLFVLFVAGFSRSWMSGYLKGIWIFLFLIGFAYLFYRMYRVNKNNDYKTLFKGKVIWPIVSFISEDLVYKPEHKVQSTDYRKSRLFLQGVDKYRGDDLIEGKIDKTVFHFSELHTQYKTTNSKGQTSWHTIFKGLFFVGDFNKDFQGSTILLPNQIGGAFSFFKKIFGLNRKEKLVELADPTFSENFNCYSTDDIKARYILTPALMQRLNRFHEKYPDNRVALSFVDGQIFVAISYTKDLFEPSYFKSIVNYSRLRNYFDDIRLVVEIVEDLNLNNRIWTKK